MIIFVVSCGYFSSEIGQIHYRIKGKRTDNPIILFIHEMPLSSDVFVPILENLGENFVGIAVDLPGYGYSQNYKGCLQVEDYAKIINQLMKGLGFNQFNVFGVHGGASIAIEMENQNPKYINNLILSGVPVLDDIERKKLHEGLPSLKIKNTGAHLQNFWDYFNNKWDNNASENIVHLAVMNIMKAGKNYDIGYRSIFNYEVEPVIKMCKKPILLLVSEKDPLRNKNEIIQKMNLMTSEIVINTPYHIHLTTPIEVVNQLKNFILK